MVSKSAYVSNAFLLTIPILLWNLLFADLLPAVFQTDTFENAAPQWLRVAETGSRILFFIVVYLMPLDIRAPGATTGLLVYVLGVAAYFVSWSVLVVAPDSAWAASLIGFTAPAWTPVIWMAGICLSGHRFSFGIPFNRCFPLIASLLFLTFHVVHAIMVYHR